MLWMRAPVPFEAALQNCAGTAAAEIEADAEVHLKHGRDLPVSSAEQLMHLRLRARWDIDALDFTVILQRRREGPAFPTQEQRGLEIPAVRRSGTADRALDHGVEHHLPSLKFAIDDGAQLD